MTPDGQYRISVGIRPRVAKLATGAMAYLNENGLTPETAKTAAKMAADELDFATNLRALLGQAPLAGHTVLGLDPGPGFAPVRDPTRIDLAAENGDAASELFGLGEVGGVCPGVESDGGAGDRPGLKHVGGGAVGREERERDPGLLPSPFQGQEILPVVAVFGYIIVSIVFFLTPTITVAKTTLGKDK